MSNARSARPSVSMTIGMSWLTPSSFGKVQPLGCACYATDRLRERRSRGGHPRDRRSRAARGGLGGADGPGAARGVVRERGRARRATRRGGALPLGRRRGAARGRPRGRARGAARPRLGRRGPGRLHARGGAGRDAHLGARGLGRVVDGARAAGPGARVDGGVDRVFAALGDPGRRELVRAISERGSATATELAADLPVTRQAVAKQLAGLAEAGLVVGERRGRETPYALTPEPLADAAAWMADVGAAWDSRPAALRRHLDPPG